MLLDVHARTVVKVLLVAALFLLAVAVVLELRGLIMQIAIAGFLTVAADPLVRRMERRGLARGRAVGLLLAIVVLAMALVVSVFVPPLVEQANKLIAASPALVEDVRSSRIYDRLDQQFGIVETASRQAERLPGLVSDQLGTALAVVISGIFGALTIVFLTLFLLLGGRQLVEGIVRLFPTLVERRTWNVVEGAYTGVSAYVGGVIVIALIAGTTMTTMALLLGLPYALPLGLWMGLLVIIPLIGATIGAIPAIIVAFVAGGVIKGLVMATFVVCYQQLENLIIQPRIQGRAASLSPLTVFLAVLVGAQLLGVVGALFAVPVAGVLQIIARQVIEQQGTSDLQLPGSSTTPDPDPPPPAGEPIVAGHHD
jgi:putative heme transporter